MLGAAAACLVPAATGQFFAPERWEYSVIARNLLSGRGSLYRFLGADYYSYGSWLYPRLLAAVLWATGGREWVMVVVHALLAGATSLVVLAIARRMFGELEALSAGVVTALHPGLLVYAGKLHAQTLDVFLIACSFLLLLRLSRDPTKQTALLTGVVASLAAMSRATIVPFYVAWAMWFVVTRRLPRRNAVALACAAAGVLGVLGAVATDAYARVGRVVPLRGDIGINLWVGNHAGATGTSFTASAQAPPLGQLLPPDLLSRIRGQEASVQNGVFIREVSAFIRSHPAEFARTFVNKLWYFWWRSPHTGLLYPAAWTRIYAAYYAVLAIAAAMAWWRAARSGDAAARNGAHLFLLLALAFSITQALFYVDGRHRWQIEPLMIVFAGASLPQLLRPFRAYRLTVRRTVPGRDAAGSG